MACNVEYLLPEIRAVDRILSVIVKHSQINRRYRPRHRRKV